MSVPATTAQPAPPVATPAQPAPLMKMPDITPAQIAAAATGAIGLAVAIGVPMSHNEQLAIEGFIGAFAPLLLLVDAWIRHSRAKYVHNALIQAAQAVATVQPLAVALAPQGNGESAAVTAAIATPLPTYIK